MLELESIRCGLLPGEHRFYLCELTGHRQGLDAQFHGPHQWLRCTCGAEFSGPLPLRVARAAA